MSLTGHSPLERAGGTIMGKARYRRVNGQRLDNRQRGQTMVFAPLRPKGSRPRLAVTRRLLAERLEDRRVLSTTNGADSSADNDDFGVPQPRDALYVWRNPDPRFDGTPVTHDELFRLIDFAHAEGITTIFYDNYGNGQCGQPSGIQFRTEDCPAFNDQVLSGIVHTLHEAGLKVQALYTDATRFDDLQMYQSRVAAAQRFDGIRLNFEGPWPGRGNEPTSTDDIQFYADVVNAAADLPLFVSIGHHWDTPIEYPSGGTTKPAFEHIIDITAGVDVQTTWDETIPDIGHRAGDEVRYAVTHGKEGHITIETYDVLTNLPDPELTERNTFFNEGCIVMRQRLDGVMVPEISNVTFAFHFYRQSFGSTEFPLWNTPCSLIRDKIGIHRGREWFFDVNDNRVWDGAARDARTLFGVATDVPLVGDWNGDGVDEIGVHRGDRFYLDLNGNGVWDGPGTDAVFAFGNAGDVAVVGDWNGDGVDDIGVRRGRAFYLDLNGNRVWNTSADGVFPFGNIGDEPVTGDWEADGTSDIGVHRGNKWYLDLNDNRAWDPGVDGVFPFGTAGDEAVIGDWNNDGVDDLGVHRGNGWYLDANGNRTWNGAGVDAFFTFGNAGDDALAGRFGSFALTARGTPSAGSTAALAPEQVAPVLGAATDLLAARLPLAPSQLQLLVQTQVVIADLGGSRLAQYAYGTIVLDDDAAGFGWFVDPTPLADEEFTTSESGELVAGDPAPSGQMDLLTAVLHEMGHLLGLSHSDDELNAMFATLAAGVRRK